jgi:hypothetical protein
LLWPPILPYRLPTSQSSIQTRYCPYGLGKPLMPSTCVRLQGVRESGVRFPIKRTFSLSQVLARLRSLTPVESAPLVPAGQRPRDFVPFSACGRRTPASGMLPPDVIRLPGLATRLAC